MLRCSALPLARLPAPPLSYSSQDTITDVVFHSSYIPKISIFIEMINFIEIVAMLLLLLSVASQYLLNFQIYCNGKL